MLSMLVDESTWFFEKLFNALLFEIEIAIRKSTPAVEAGYRASGHIDLLRLGMGRQRSPLSAASLCF
jgi:hypothetical protein